MTYISLHNHTNASFLDSLVKPKELAEAAKAAGMSAVAITDHHNLFNAVHFYNACMDVGIKPILGIEMNFVFDCEQTNLVKSRRISHITLLAENNVGWRNLTKLLNKSNTSPYYWFKPRIDLKLLSEHSEGIICLTGCIGGIVAGNLVDEVDSSGAVIEKHSYFKAASIVRRLKTIFNRDHLFIEAQLTGHPQQERILTQLRQLSREYDLRLVPTSNTHYLEKDDSHSHKILVKMQSDYSKQSLDEFSTDEFYFKTEADMSSTFTADEIENTAIIAERCQVTLDLKKPRLPTYPFLPTGKTATEYLRELAVNELKKRCLTSAEYKSRLNKELVDIEEMGFSDYFLIVWDIITWAKNQGILVGPGRGSASGSIVSYLLNITTLDPIKHGLIWERFLNRGRKGLPDIDTDVQRSRRQEVIQYIKSRFGEDNVTQLVTLGQLSAKNVIKDVFRVFDVPFTESNLVTDAVPDKNEDHGRISLEEALEMSPQLRAYAEQYKAYFKIAGDLEGCYRNIGLHAGAVIISDRPFSEGNYPLCKAADSDNLVFAWDMGIVDKLKILKLDLLGLNTLDIFSDCFELIKRRHGKSLSMDTIPLDDEKTFELLSSGRTTGIFQLDKSLGKAWSRRLKPANIQEISDLISLIRPGPLDSGMTNIYENVKINNDVPAYVDSKLKSILDPNYGVLLYQEDIIKICKDLSLMNAEESDFVRAAVSKKKPEEIKKWRSRFIDGCLKNDIAVDNANKIWDWIEKFAGYGFCAAHGLSYSLIAYYTAYLKTNYPVEFFTACLRNAEFAADKLEDLNLFINDARSFGIKVSPPSVTSPSMEFDAIDDNHIVFGLTSIKGVGKGIVSKVKQINFNRPYLEFLPEFAALNKRAIEALIMCGALDHTKLSRRQMLAYYNLWSALTENEQKIINFCGISAIIPTLEKLCAADLPATQFKLPNVRRREALTFLVRAYKVEPLFDDKSEKASWEKELLGIVLTSHETLGYTAKNTLRDLVEYSESFHRVELVANIEQCRQILTKKGKNPGQEMAFLTLSDHTGRLDNFVVFPDTYKKYGKLLTNSKIVRIKGQVNERGSIIVDFVEYIK